MVTFRESFRRTDPRIGTHWTPGFPRSPADQRLQASKDSQSCAPLSGAVELMESKSHGIRPASLESTAAVNYSVAVLYTGPVAALQVQELVASAVFAGTWRSRNTVMNVKLELLCAVSGKHFSFGPSINLASSFP